MSTKTSLQKIFPCAISKYICGNIARENYLCSVNPDRTDIVLQENNLRNRNRNLYKAINCAMLANSPQSSQCCLDVSETTLCGTHYLRNVSQQCTVIFSQEDNLYYNVVLIYLSQHCTRNYLCNVDPQSTNNSVNNLQICLDISEPTLHKEITSAILAHMAERQCLSGKQPIKCCIDPSETLHKKTTCTVLTQSAHTCFRRKTGCSFK